MKLFVTFVIGAVVMFAALSVVGKIRERIEEANFVRVNDNGQWLRFDMRNVDHIKGDDNTCTFVWKSGEQTTVGESYYKVMFRIAATTCWSPK